MQLAVQLFQHFCADVSLPTTSVLSWPPESLSASEVAVYLQRHNLIRKFEGSNEVSRDAKKMAIRKFLDANKHSEAMNNDPFMHCESLIDEYLLGEFESSLRRFFDRCVDDARITDNALDHFNAGRPGPGASIATRHTDFYHKMFESRISVTPGLLPIWQYCTTSETVEPLANAFFFARERYGVEVVEASKVSVVPKTVDVGRAIGTEPSANMWMQRGLSAQIEAGLQWVFGLDLADQQDKNRILAQYGSITDLLVTLDLESASDTISLSLLRFIPKWFRDFLLLYRCENVRVGKSDQKLHMISTMGNGFTFSLMTLIMACVVDASARLSGVRLTRWSHGTAPVSRITDDLLSMHPGNWGVFGDDIICPKSIEPSVQRLLKLLGFKVNQSKSFVTGPFRESCGGDYFRGEDVRSVFVKHLEKRADLFVAFNSLVSWSALHGVPIPRTLVFLYKLLERNDEVKQSSKIPWVPMHCNLEEGINCPSRLLRIDHPKDENGSLEYEKWDSSPSLVVVDRTTVAWKKRLHKRGRIKNLFGLSQALLYGAIRGGTLAVRINDRSQLKYKSTRCVTPNWDMQCHKVGRTSPDPGRVIDVLESVLF